MFKVKIYQLYKKIKNYYYSYIQPFFLRGNDYVKCPFCNWKGKEFHPYGVVSRKNALCPKCGSVERHRLYFLYLKQKIPIDRKIKVLHFAPETILTNLFKSYKNVEYLTADLEPKKAMVIENITHLSFANNSFDIIFCSHVLEHIQDDKKAMREILRILKPDGFAILQVPIKDEFKGNKIDVTFEDPSITNPKDREVLFGQKDHVRIYGRDYQNRLINSGFNVTIDKFGDSLSDVDIKKYSLLPNDVTCNETEKWIYYCTK